MSHYLKDVVEFAQRERLVGIAVFLGDILATNRQGVRVMGS